MSFTFANLKTARRLAGTLLCGSIIATGQAWAQTTLQPDAALIGDDPDGVASPGGDGFAVSSDSWEDWLFVGASRESAMRDGGEVSDGAVYIYRKGADGEYAQTQKLLLPGTGSGPDGDLFGAGVDAAGGWLFVAAADDRDFPGQTDPRGQDFRFAGQVHVYRLENETWTYRQTLTAPNPRARGNFGARSQSSNIALRDDAKVAVIGETNSFDTGPGALHTFRLKKGSWSYVQTIEAPLPSSEQFFGDSVVFLDKKYLLAGGVDVTDGNSQGYLAVYKSKGASGRFFSSPDQIEYGNVFAPWTCPVSSSNYFGNVGLDANGGTVVVSDPCVGAPSGPFAGEVSVYRQTGGGQPLTLDTTISGTIPFRFPGSNIFTSRETIAVSPDGNRFLVSQALGNGDGRQQPDGAETLLYTKEASGWTLEALLTTDTPATNNLRAFGDAVFFANSDTAIVREANTLDTSPREGVKSQALLYDLSDLPD